MDFTNGVELNWPHRGEVCGLTLALSGQQTGRWWRDSVQTSTVGLAVQSEPRHTQQRQRGRALSSLCGHPTDTRREHKLNGTVITWIMVWWWILGGDKWEIGVDRPHTLCFFQCSYSSPQRRPVWGSSPLRRGTAPARLSQPTLKNKLLAGRMESPAVQGKCQSPKTQKE